MAEALETQLKGILKKLEQSSDQIIKTRGYTQEVEKIRILEELIKEQLKHENTHSATR